MRLTRPKITRRLLIVEAGTVELLAEPASAYADQHENRRLHDLRHAQIFDVPNQNTRDQTKSGRHQARA